MRELMDRVAAADPVPDAGLLSPEEQREADLLLERVLATPIEPAAEPRPRVRRRLVVALGAACAALAAVVAVSQLGSGGPSVVEKAVAAMTRPDTVYHVLKRSSASGSGLQKAQTVYFESWHTTDGRVHDKVFAPDGARRGRLLEEFAGKRRPGRTSGPALRYDARRDIVYPSGFGSPPETGEVPALDPYADPGARLRELEGKGELRVADTIRFAGRRAYRLVATRTTRWRAFSYEDIEFLVDAETYLPLAESVTVRFDSKTYRLSTRYLSYERLPLDAQSARELHLDPHPGARCAIGAGEKRGLGFPNPCAR